MASTYYSNAVLAGVAPDSFKAGETVTVLSYYKAPAAISAGSTIQMIPIPKNAIVFGMRAKIANVATAALAGSIGDGGSTARYHSSLSFSADGTFQSAIDTAGLFYQYSAADTIDILTSGAALPISGAITFQLSYTVLGGMSNNGLTAYSETITT